MGCIVTLLALITPRVAIVLIWLLTNWLETAYETTLWPVLGFIFLPYTTLAYAAAMLHNYGSVDGVWLVLVVVAVLADLGFFGRGAQRGWRRRS